MFSDEMALKLAGIKLDPNALLPNDSMMIMPHVPQPPVRPISSSDQKSRASSGRQTSANKLKTPVPVQNLEIQPMVGLSYSTAR